MMDQGLIYVIPPKKNYGVHKLSVNFSLEIDRKPSEDVKGIKDFVSVEQIEPRSNDDVEMFEENREDRAINKILNIMEESRHEVVQRMLDKKKEELELYYKRVQDLAVEKLKPRNSFSAKLVEYETITEEGAAKKEPPTPSTPLPQQSQPTTPRQNSTFSFSNFTTPMTSSIFGSTIQSGNISDSSTFKFITSTPTISETTVPSESTTFSNFSATNVSNTSTLVGSINEMSTVSKIQEDSEMIKAPEDDVTKPPKPIFIPTQPDLIKPKEEKLKDEKPKIDQDTKSKQDALESQKNAENQIEKFYKDFEDSFKNFTSDNRFKAYRTDLQLFIRTTINTISGNSVGEVKTKSTQLLRLLSKAPVNYQGNQLDCCKHEQALNFCLSFTAKSFVNSGVVQVSSVPAAAFPTGACIAIIWSRLPTFGKLFLGALSEKCPYAKPSYSGHRGADDEGFIKRCRALLMIYGAVIQINLSTPNPHGMRYAWTWVSSKLRQPPNPFISANILQAFLQTTSFKMAKCYKLQFYKILFFIKDVYLPMIAKVTGAEGTKQPFIKFELFIKELIDRLKKHGSISQPQGYIESIFM